MSFLLGQVVVVWTLLLPLAGLRWWEGFRGYFANDQLSYAAIAITFSKGIFIPVEPLTETGTSHYPSLWYLILGLISWGTQQPVPLVWTIMGLGMIGATIAFLGALAYRCSGLAIAPLFPAVALVTGTFSVITSQWWYTSLGYHAVIWGPFGTLFTLNAEAVGLMVNLLALSLLVHAAAFTRWRAAAVTSAAILIGALANVQTYAFLTGVSAATAFISTLAVMRYPSRARALASLALLGTVLLLGPWIAQIIGPLPLFALVIASATPAFLPLFRTHRALTLTAGMLFALAASPQVIRTLLGLASGDDFLTYRQASTQDLGIDPGAALIAVLPALAIIIVNIAALIATRHLSRNPLRNAFRALMVSLVIGLLVMSTNDLWGFNQEPYRFWLQYMFLAIFLGAVMLPWSLRQWRGLTQGWRITSAVVGSVAIIVWSMSLGDVQAFRKFAQEQGVINVQDERALTLRSLVPADRGLVLASACQDPQVLKLITRAPVAAFNRGLAWPENRVAIDTFFDPDRGSDVSIEELDTAGIGYVLTESDCANEWRFSDGRIQPIAVKPLDDALITLWQVRLPR